jgi:hypothetical protein
MTLIRSGTGLACPRLPIGRLGQQDLLAERGLARAREIEMAQAMAADLEIRIGDQLLGALLVGLHPLAAGEERGLDALRAQQIDDAPVIAGDVAVGLAEIEGKSDQLLVGRQADAPDRAA